MSYLLFAGATYYARGGWADHVGTYADLSDALVEARRRAALTIRDYRGAWDSKKKAIYYPDDHIDHLDWWHIVCDGRVVASGSFEVGRSAEDDQWTEDLDPNQEVWWTA